MLARVTRVHFDESPIGDQRIEDARGLMKAVSTMAGHQGAIWLVNRASGEAMAIDLYAEARDLENTSQGDLRDELIRLLEGRLLSVEEYEVAGLDRVFDAGEQP